MTLDDKTFIALEDAFFGTGASDATTQPLSTYKENRVHANNRFLAAGAHKNGWAPHDDTGNFRPQGSIAWGCRYLQVLRVEPNTKTIRVDMVGTVANQLTTGAVDVRACLLTYAGGQIGQVIGTVQATAQWKESDGLVHFIEIDLSNAFLSAPTDCVVAVFTKSAVDGALLFSQTHASLIKTGNSNRVRAFRESSFESITVDETMFLRMKNSGRDADIIGRVSAGGVVWCPIHLPDARGFDPLDSGEIYELRRLSYINAASWSVGVEQDTEKTTLSFVAKSHASMRAQLPVLGQDTSQHGINTDGVYTTLRSVGQGPQGGAILAGAGAKPSRWARKRASTAGYTKLDSIGFRIDHANSEVIVSGFLFGVENSADEIDSSARLGRPPYSSTQSAEELQRYLLSLPLRATLVQIEGTFAATTSWGDAVTIAQEEQITKAVQLWRHTNDYRRPLLQQMMTTYHNDIYTRPMGEHFLEENNATPKYMFKEGALIDHGDTINPNTNDLQYLTPFSLVLNVADVDVSRPFRLNIELGQGQVSGIRSTGNVPLSEFFDMGRVHIYLFSCNVSTRGVYG